MRIQKDTHGKNQREREIHGQTDMKDRQTHRQTDIHTYMHRYRLSDENKIVTSDK